MTTSRTFLYAFLLFLNLSFFAAAQTTFRSSYLPDLRPRASTTTAALDCSETAAGNVSACYPNLNLIPTCCRPCLVNVTLLQPCASTDFRCLCAHASEIQIQALTCMNGTCSIADEQTAVNYYYSYCQSMDYPLTVVPSSAATSSSFSSSSASTSSTSTPAPSLSSTSLSPAAGAGIGITFAALLFLGALTIFFLHRRRRKACVGNRLPDDVGGGGGGGGTDQRGLDTRDDHPPSYPTVQEIDGKTIHNIALHERPPPETAVIRDLSDGSNASTVYEMDGRRPWSFGRSRRASQAG